MTNVLAHTRTILEFIKEILPANEQGIWANNIDGIRQRCGFTFRVFEPIHSFEKGRPVYYPKTLRVSIHKLRNGLAHNRTEPVNRLGKYEAVIVRNFYMRRGGHLELDMEAEFSCDELRAFDLFLRAKEDLGAVSLRTTLSEHCIGLA